MRFMPKVMLGFSLDLHHGAGFRGVGVEFACSSLLPIAVYPFVALIMDWIVLGKAVHFSCPDC